MGQFVKLKNIIKFLILIFSILTLSSCSSTRVNENLLCANNQIEALKSFKQIRSADIVDYEASLSKIKVLEYTSNKDSCKYLILESVHHKETYSINYYIYNYNNGIVEISLNDCINFRLEKNTHQYLGNCVEEWNNNLKQIRNIGFKYNDDYGLKGLNLEGYEKYE